MMALGRDTKKKEDKNIAAGNHIRLQLQLVCGAGVVVGSS